MVTSSSRYPLMIDPQGQAFKWICAKEPDLETNKCIVTLTYERFKDRLKDALGNGWPLLIESVESEIDPILDPVLEKQTFKKGKSLFIKVDGESDFDEKFRLYMTSRLGNPHFSPEIAAKTTIIDFTVTQIGLEQQLLGKVVSKEQKQLELQLNQLMEEVTMNTKTIQELNARLLDRLSKAQGSLIDDVELIEMLGNIKAKAREVQTKLNDAAEKKTEIMKKRELYLPVAKRGSVLYFCMIEMQLVNWMYNSSLLQFSKLFEISIDTAPKSQLTKDRVNNIIQTLTYKVYRYVNRGLFEKDKITFLLMACLRILLTDKILRPEDIGLFLKAGSGAEEKTKPIVNFINKTAWNNLNVLMRHKFASDQICFFRDITDIISKNTKGWNAWILNPNIENIPVPDYKDKIENEKETGRFIHLCLIRCLREDRTVLASLKFIDSVLGTKFVTPVTDTMEDIYEESQCFDPILFMLSAGADPTALIDELAKKKKKFPIDRVAMGEEQEKIALEKIKNGFLVGTWVMLQNCHLGLVFMAELEEIMNPKNHTIDPGFRLFLTGEPNPKFPLGLLHIAIKVTNEPPKGLKAGLQRTFATMINQDFLEKVEPPDMWREIVYATCFLHSVVQERRKYGPIGFCLPYEFNSSDLDASLMYIEKYLNGLNAIGSKNVQMKTIQFMICEIQYGGRITDDLDRELFYMLGIDYVKDQISHQDNRFRGSQDPNDYQYTIPKENDILKIREFIEGMPSTDNPEVFWLHPIADLALRMRESRDMLATLIDTQPKESATSGGLSREDEVKKNIEEVYLKDLPVDYIEINVYEKILLKKGPSRISDKKGMDVPLNVFLFQEIQRFQVILSLCRKMMKDIVAAIEGTIIMTPDIVEAITSIFNLRVPNKWLYDPTGAEISWLSPTLGQWLAGMRARNSQLTNWLETKTDRLTSYWLGLFFNPKGFLTGMKQEVNRINKANEWSLEDVVFSTEVMNVTISVEGEQKAGEKGLTGKKDDGGVFVHGLFLEGAAWSKYDGGRLMECVGQDICIEFPVVYFTAKSTAEKKEGGSPMAARAGKFEKGEMHQEKKDYNCPIYKYPKRTDRYLITRIYLKVDSSKDVKERQGGTVSSVQPAEFWKRRGVALICSKE